MAEETKKLKKLTEHRDQIGELNRPELEMLHSQLQKPHPSKQQQPPNETKSEADSSTRLSASRAENGDQDYRPRPAIEDENDAIRPMTSSENRYRDQDRDRSRDRDKNQQGPPFVTSTPRPFRTTRSSSRSSISPKPRASTSSNHLYTRARLICVYFAT